MHVAHHLLERKQHGRHRCIEGCCDGSGCADRNKGLHLFGPQSQPATEDRSDSRTHLNGWSLSAERNAARQSRRGAEELAQNGAEGNEAVSCKQGCLGLRNAAAPGVREIAIEQHAHGKRPCHRHQYAPPGCAADGIEAHSQPLRHHDKGNYRKSG